MKKLQLFSLLIAFAAAALLVASTFGGAATEADRDVSVAVADDDSAYVGYDTEIISIESNQTVEGETLVTLTNGFSDPVTVETTEKTIPSAIDSIDAPNQIDEGEVETIDADITCNSANDGGEVAITISVETTSSTAAVDLKDTETRSFNINCDVES